jgi:hypothetical protein
MSEQVAIGSGTLMSLIGWYKSDPRSAHGNLGYHTRTNYENLCRRIEIERGGLPVRQIQNDDLVNWHKEWAAGGPSIAHSLMVMLRTVFVSGATALKDGECERLAVALYKMRLRVPRPENAAMTVEQATALRERANRRGMHSIALAQAFQFECKLSQRQVIGEWVPKTEPGSSDLFRGESKWISGIKWSDVDRHLILTVGGGIKIDLKRASMVMEELSRVGRPLPQSGPVIVNEVTGLPFEGYQFRREWRATADAACPQRPFKICTAADALLQCRAARPNCQRGPHQLANDSPCGGRPEPSAARDTPQEIEYP